MAYFISMKGNKKKASQINEDVDEVLKKMGAKMKKLRKDLGYENSDDFAYDSGINRSQYGKYEAGSQDMRISSLIKAINSLGLTMEDFFKGGLEEK
jgi:transcriptional regulator with XRE-family HTH domain